MCVVGSLQVSTRLLLSWALSLLFYRSGKLRFRKAVICHLAELRRGASSYSLPY